MIVGHRGARALAPENTLVSIQRAAELGAGMVEVDLHATRDGVVVVFHDEELTAHSDAALRFPLRAPWSLADFTLEELRSLDAGAWFLDRHPYAERFTPEERSRFLAAAWLEGITREERGIPTLEEVLLRVRDLGISINLELKAIPVIHPELVQTTLEVVARVGMQDQVLYSSFDHQLLRDLKASHPEVAVGVLTGDRLARAPEYVADWVGADSFHPGASPHSDALGIFLRRRHPLPGQTPLESLQAEVAAFRNRGLRVFPWTVNPIEDLVLLQEAGVDGIITDFPHRMADSGS